jgi:hypothetical protein
MAVASEIYTNHSNIRYRQNVELVSVKPGGIESSHSIYSVGVLMPLS